ncbi:MAG: hypothetical protein QNL62_14150 [Gammaproteobacteria bacterium]|nr:hypothetical protein [Gammaproteobacteria bacterium]
MDTHNQNTLSISNPRRTLRFRTYKKMIILGLISGLAGCNAKTIIPYAYLPAAEPKSEAISVSTQNAVLTHLDKKKKRQTKNMVTIDIEPISNELEKWFKYELTKEAVVYTSSNNVYPYIQKKIPFYKYDSDRLKLRAKIQNNSDRVLHLKNIIISFEIDGKNTSVAGDFYSNLSSAIITPNSNKEIIFYGPRVEELKDKNGVIKLGIYEVNIGNKFTNYEWYLSYTTETVTKDDAVIISEVNLQQYEAEALQDNPVKAPL